MNDLVASITGIAVSERIPDHVFDSADQVELVDIEPADLIVRLQSGKVYQGKQAQRALGNFFSQENLAALREIALRRTADRLNRTAQKSGNEAAARAGEHILICLSSAPSNAKVIRTAARMAEAFHSGFTALFVETPATRELKGDNLKRLRDNLRLAEQLGRSNFHCLRRRSGGADRGICQGQRRDKNCAGAPQPSSEPADEGKSLAISSPI